MGVNRELATQIFEALEAKGAGIGNASITIIEKVLDEQGYKFPHADCFYSGGCGCNNICLGVKPHNPANRGMICSDGLIKD